MSHPDSVMVGLSKVEMTHFSLLDDFLKFVYESGCFEEFVSCATAIWIMPDLYRIYVGLTVSDN